MRDTGGDRAENHRTDDQLDQTDEDIAQGLEVDTDLRPQPAHNGAEHDAEQHLHVDRF